MVRDAVSLYGFWTYLGMCFIAKVVFILAIYNASNPCFGPFLSDTGNSNWFKYQISKPISGRLLARGATCLYSFPRYLQGTVCRAQPVYTVSESTSRGLFARAQPVYTVFESPSRGLFARAAACFPTYLKVTPGDCPCRMQPVYTVSNATFVPTGECWSRVRPVFMVSKPI